MKQPQNEGSDYGWLLFPNQKVVEQRPVSDAWTTPLPLIPKKRHQTRFVYVVGYADMAKGGVLMGALDPSVKMHYNVVLAPTMHGASAE
jgi:hypothetical protein